jgi:hypothetical protein
MLYAVLCYHSEDKLAKSGRLGPVAQLMPTTSATTLRKDQDPPLVIDGPFAALDTHRLNE